MRNWLAPTLLVMAAACATQHYVQAGQKDGVAVSYRWDHPENKPSALLLRIVNGSDERRRVHAEIDLYFQGRTVEQFEADTVVAPHRTLSGRFNGFYFTPTSLTRDQLRSAETTVELTTFTTEVAPTGQ